MKNAVLEAGEVAMRHFGKVRVEFKTDGSVVTQADREIDALLNRRGHAMIPEAAYIGEETARDEATVRHARESEWVWVADPIDGTSAFADGIETFCVSFGLLRDGQPYAGAVCFPALNHLYEGKRGTDSVFREQEGALRKRSGNSIAPDTSAPHAKENGVCPLFPSPAPERPRRRFATANRKKSKIQLARRLVRRSFSEGGNLAEGGNPKSKITKGGAWYDDQPIRVLTELPVHDRAILYTDWDAHLHYRITWPGKTRGLGSAALHYLLVARGVAVGAISAAHVWDYAAAAVIVKEAGGIIRHLDGREINWRDYLDGRNLCPPVLAAPPALWTQLAATMQYVPRERQ